MKLKAVSKENLSDKTKHEERVKLGRRSRTKGANFERTVAEKFKKAYDVDLKRTPQSGGFAKKSEKADDFRGDVVPVDKDVELAIHIEAKNTKTWSLPKWFQQAEGDCPKDKKPVVVFHQHNSSKDYIAMSLEDFFELVPKDRVVILKGGK